MSGMMVFDSQEWTFIAQKEIKNSKNTMKNISNISLEDIINCLYRIDNTIHQDFTHIVEYLSDEFLNALEKEKMRFVDEENKRSAQWECDFVFQSTLIYVVV